MRCFAPCTLLAIPSPLCPLKSPVQLAMLISGSIVCPAACWTPLSATPTTSSAGEAAPAHVPHRGHPTWRAWRGRTPCTPTPPWLMGAAPRVPPSPTAQTGGLTRPAAGTGMRLSLHVLREQAGVG